MVSGLPDYTKYVSPQVVVTESNRPFGTKAETIDKKITYVYGLDGACNIGLVSQIGYFAGLILLVASTDGAGAVMKCDVWLGDTNITIWDGVQVPADTPLVIAFPCFIPDQDLGDGFLANIRIYLTGACGEKVSLFAIWFEEDQA